MDGTSPARQAEADPEHCHDHLRHVSTRVVPVATAPNEAAPVIAAKSIALVAFPCRDAGYSPVMASAADRPPADMIEQQEDHSDDEQDPPEPDSNGRQPKRHWEPSTRGAVTVLRVDSLSVAPGTTSPWPNRATNSPATSLAISYPPSAGEARADRDARG
jgi:hypothetical protein